MLLHEDELGGFRSRRSWKTHVLDTWDSISGMARMPEKRTKARKFRNCFNILSADLKGLF